LDVALKYVLDGKTRTAAAGVQGAIVPVLMRSGQVKWLEWGAPTARHVSDPDAPGARPVPSGRTGYRVRGATRVRRDCAAAGRVRRGAAVLAAGCVKYTLEFRDGMVKKARILSTFRAHESRPRVMLVPSLEKKRGEPVTSRFAPGRE
jgi:hypothetical protein